MTVKELIEILQKCNQEAEVKFWERRTSDTYELTKDEILIFSDNVYIEV